LRSKQVNKRLAHMITVVAASSRPKNTNGWNRFEFLLQPFFL
jgi:hypothetical protein